MNRVMQDKIIVGNCSGLSEYHESSLKFRYTPDSFQSVWNFSDRLARFVASYYSLFSIGRDYNSLLFIINEIVENALKHTKDPSLPIEVEMYQCEEMSFLKVTNEVSEQSFHKFLDYAYILNETDLKNLYCMKLEDLSSGKSTSGIGLILLKKDYHIELGFEFRSENGHYWTSICARI